MIRKGSRVQWNWGKGTAEGKVMETHTTKTTKTLKRATVTRNGTEDDRALYIKQDDGDHGLTQKRKRSKARRSIGSK